jgi:hypothetical protein
MRGTSDLIRYALPSEPFSRLPIDGYSLDQFAPQDAMPGPIAVRYDLEAGGQVLFVRGRRIGRTRRQVLARVSVGETGLQVTDDAA